MIFSLTGVISDKEPHGVVVTTPGGVGYLVSMSHLQMAAYSIGQNVSVYTYFKVSDQGQDLYGFKSKEERAFFMLLLSVKGIGPKSALHVLSLGSIPDIQSAIGRGDSVYLSSVQGLGKKMAERICVELKGKMRMGDGDSGTSFSSDSGMLGDVVAALIGMGYTQEEAKQRVLGIDTEGKSVGQLLKDALKK